MPFCLFKVNLVQMYKKMNVSSIIFYIQFPSKYLSAIKMPQKTTGQNGKQDKTSKRKCFRDLPWCRNKESYFQRTLKPHRSFIICFKTNSLMSSLLFCSLNISVDKPACQNLLQQKSKLLGEKKRGKQTSVSQYVVLHTASICPVKYMLLSMQIV